MDGSDILADVFSDGSAHFFRLADTCPLFQEYDLISMLLLLTVSEYIRVMSELTSDLTHDNAKLKNYIHGFYTMLELQ